MRTVQNPRDVAQTYRASQTIDQKLPLGTQYAEPTGPVQLGRHDES
jgi:hypothetical protein